MLFSLTTWIAIVVAGTLGCFATGVAVKAAFKVPIGTVAAQPGKQLWSVIFAIPLPFLLAISPMIVGILVAAVALALMPTVASKLFFGPKDVPFHRLMIFNGVYAVTAICVFLIIQSLI